MHAGPLIRSWLCKIFNAIVNLEAIPSPFKTGVIIPIYKGKGRDPLLPTSCRGITLTSVIAKTFEYSILDRMGTHLSVSTVKECNYRSVALASIRSFAVVRAVLTYVYWLSVLAGSVSTDLQEKKKEDRQGLGPGVS